MIFCSPSSSTSRFKGDKTISEPSFTLLGVLDIPETHYTNTFFNIITYFVYEIAMNCRHHSSLHSHQGKELTAWKTRNSTLKQEVK